MDHSTNQELNRMTVRHRLFGVVISTILGLSAYVLSAQEVDETSESSTRDQTTTSAETDSEQNASPVEDQLTKEFLQKLSKDEFKEYMLMLDLDQYSANDQRLIRMEYQRRCSDDSKESSLDLCPDDIEPSWGNTARDSDEVVQDSDEVVQDSDELDQETDESEQTPSMPELEEQSVEVLYAQPNEKTGNAKDPRRNNDNSTKQKNGLVPAWRNK